MASSTDLGFAHLHVHSEHSALDSTARVGDIIAAAKADGQEAVAITDHGSLASIFDAVKAGKEAGVKIIPGLEAYLAIGSRTDPQTIEVPAGGASTDSGEEVSGKTKTKRYHHLTVLATTPAGWRNLVAMHNASQQTPIGKHPAIDYDLLAEHSEGLVVLTGCLGGPVLGPMARGDEAGARQGLEDIIGAVGHDNVYVEVMDHDIPEESAVLGDMAKLAKSYGLPLIATNDSHHARADGARAHEAWLATQTQKTLADPSPPRFAFTGHGYHMRTGQEMRAVRDETWWAKACDNTVKLADSVAGDMMPKHYLRLPKFPVPEGFKDSREYFIHLVKAGAKARYGDPYPEEVAKRLNTEMRVLSDFGVIDYFLIVHELIAWARSQGILVGPGRGCLVGDDLVWTTDGYKPLRQVRIGDTVRSHTGALRRVSNTMRYDCDEDLYEVRAYSDGRGATMTGDHKVLVVRAEPETDKRKLAHGYRFKPDVTNTPQWVQAKDIEVGDFVLSPRPASPSTAPTVIDVAPLLPAPPKGVEYLVTDTEIIERVPTNIPYPHSVRAVSAASGMSRNVIQSVLARADSFDDAEAPVARPDPRAQRMRDRLLTELQARGFDSLADYGRHLTSNAGATRYSHSATAVAKTSGLNVTMLRRVVDSYPESGPITHMVSAGTRSAAARRRLAAELTARGFGSFAEWDRHINRNATYEVRTPRYVYVDSDLLFLLGGWASNGWLRTDSERAVGWAEQASTADDTIPRLVRRVWSLDVSTAKSTTADLVQYGVRSAAVRALFRHLAPDYGMTAQTKHLPSWVADLGEGGKRALLGGLWWGDGSIAGGRWQYSTSSPRLAHQVRDLLWSVGAPAGLYEDDRTDEREEYANRSISWRIGTTPNFQPAVMQFGWTEANYVYQRVRSVQKVSPAGEVFDIEVPVDQSYMTDSYVVHNSASGSVTSYALGIVNVDPLRFDLLFERFLDPTRIGMPDIDVDFEKARRGEVLAHLVHMYGQEFVARIGIFQVSKTKASLKSAARVLSHPASLGDTLSKVVPMRGADSFTFTELDAQRDGAAAGFWETVQADTRAEEAVELARQFEQVTTGRSIHACGVVISDVPLTDLVPMRRDTGKDANPEDPAITEWDADGVDDGIGLLKLDVLGIRNLDIIAAAVRIIFELTGEVIDPDNLPDGDDLDDERVLKTWQLIARGHTSGLFQLESRGMTELAQDVSPSSLEHLSALVALFRPGPLSANMHTIYAARKNGREAIDYGIFTHDKAEQAEIAKVLGPTYGVNIYQESSMLLGDLVAGFGPAERNRLRKSVSKKIASEVEAVGELFMAGAVRDVASDGSSKLAFSERTASKVWDSIKGGAAYAFNKCLTGDTEVESGGNSTWTVEHLHRRLHGTELGPGDTCPRCHERPARPNSAGMMCGRCASWLTMFNDPDRGFSLLAVDSADGRIRPQKMADVHHNGFREVFQITLADGREARATDNHRFMDADMRYVHVRDIDPGRTSLATIGDYEVKQYVPEDYRLSRGPRQGVGPLYGPGKENIGYIDRASIALKALTEQTTSTASCAQCGKPRSEGRLERAHLDGDRTNNTPGNLRWLCVSHHKAHDYRHNGRRRRWQKGRPVESSMVVSVEPAGVEPVYDIEMAPGTDHNFVANGIVSHNSHSAAYGQVAYVTAFLKANWPAAFGAAVLSQTDEDEKRSAILGSLATEGITVLPPQVNSAQFATTATDAHTVVLGLGETKDVGKAALAIIAERDQNGPFTGPSDILSRTRTPGKDGKAAASLTSTTLAALIEAGAMDEFGPRLGQMRVLRALRSRPSSPVPSDEWGLVERAVRQHQRLGLSLGQHPMSAISDQVKGWNPDLQDEWGNPLGSKPMPLHRVLSCGRKSVVTIGLVTGWKIKADNRGGQRATLHLEGSKGRIEAVVWDNTLRALRRSGHSVGVGSVIGVLANVRTREIEQRDEEGNTTTTLVHSLTVSRMWPLDYTDVDAHAPTGGLGLELAEHLFSPAASLQATQLAATGGEKVTTSALFAAPEPAPVPKPAEQEQEQVIFVESGEPPPGPARLSIPPNDFYDALTRVRTYLVEPASAHEQPLLVVSLPEGVAEEDLAWQQDHLSAHHQTQGRWVPAGRPGWSRFEPTEHSAEIAA